MYIIFVCGYQSYKASLTAECTVKGFSQISRKNTLISSGGWKSECEAGGECTQPLWMSPESKGNFCLSQMLGTTWLQTSDVSTQSYFWDFPEDINLHIFSTYQVLLSPLLSNIKYLEDGELMVFKMSSSKSFDILPDVEKALSGGIGEGMGEVTEHISGHWGQTAAPHWATTAPFGSLSIYFRRFDTYFWTPSNSFSSLSTIYYQRL